MVNINRDKLYKLLNDLTVRNSDNGICFIDTQRLERINHELKDSRFEYCHRGKLFHTYAQVPFEELPEKIIVISSHVDFKRSTKKCFSDDSHEEYLTGTYDNSISNAAIVTLMKECRWPHNIVVVFTGDEEENQGGALEFSGFITKELKRKAKCIVLDVTESGNDVDAVFTIENDCWKKNWGRRVLKWAAGVEMPWRYVPYEMSRLKKDMIKELVDKEHCITEEADEDESTTYYDNGIRCFSFCIPIELMDPNGENAYDYVGMHSDDGVRVRKDAFENYIQALYEVIWVTYQ